MCIPPVCEPATRCFGCCSLRFGAIVIILLDACYGLGMVFLHAVLLGEHHEQFKGIVTSSNGAMPLSITRDHWLIQFIDLDLSWGHRLVGFDDFKCLLAGLFYGMIIIIVTVFTLSSICRRDANKPWVSRWFVVFAHLELIAYVAVNMAKYPQLCKLRREYYPSLEATCDVLRFAFVERAAFGLVLGSMVLWIVGSFAYLTARGIDAEALNYDSDEEVGPPTYVLPPIVQNYSHPATQSVTVLPPVTMPGVLASGEARSFTHAAPIYAGSSTNAGGISLLSVG